MTLFYLFVEFIKTGLFAVGGGLATIPFLKEIALEYKWFSVDELTDMIAVAESTPGPIGINMSTYSGFKADGFIGAAVATISIIIPPVIIILIISKVLQKFKANKYVNKIFSVLRPASSGLILGAMMDIFIISFFYKDKLSDFSFSIQNILGIINFKSILFFALMYIGVLKLKKFSPIAFIACGAVFGIILGL